MAWPAGRAEDAEDETRKRLGAMAAAGSTLAIFDNLRAGMPWDSDSLNNCITSGGIIDRQLGSNSASAMTPRRFMAQIIATGNNVLTAGDLADRAMIIELETTDANRREVATTHYAIGEASGYALRHRPSLLAAAITMMAAYIKAGRPSVAGAAWGNFDEYTDLVAGAIRWTIGTDPLKDRVAMAQRTDPIASALLTLATNWVPAFGDLPVMARFIETRISNPDDDDHLGAIAEALATLGAVKLNSHAIGKLLQKYAGRIISNPADGSRHRLDRSENRGGHEHASRWRVTRL
jgi:putative DNA primase/helicase